MKTRRRPLRILPMFILAVALGLGATPALATVADDGVFEIEGDVLDSNAPAAPPDDWNTLFSCPPSPSLADCTDTTDGSAIARRWTKDGTGLSIFTTGGSKDESDIQQWRWTNGSVPDKDNLISGFAARYNGTDPRLYFGADREANNGDAQIGTWFLQTTTFLCGATGPTGVPAGTGGCQAGTFVQKDGSPAHQEIGNILVLSNFTNGGNAANIAAFVVTAVVPNGAVTLAQIAAGASNTNLACDGLGNLCAATNNLPTPALGGYYVPKFGTQGTYPPESLFEGGLKLTPFGLEAECFGSFLNETRSSQSISAQLKDFVLAKFQDCEANARTEIYVAGTTTPDKTNTIVPRNTSIYDKIFVQASPGAPAVEGTATFSFFTNGACEGTPSTTQTVSLTDQGGGLSTATSSNTGSLAAGSYSFLAQYNGGSDPNYPDDAVAACEPITVSSPEISISKTCTAAHDATTITVTFGGTVTNSGDEPLTNIVISDVPVSANITHNCADPLPKGGTCTYSGTYVSGSLSNSDTATVTADSTFAGSGSVTANATANCSTSVAPSISVSKTCVTRLVVNDTPGRLVVKDTISGQVCNTGDVQVQINSLVDTDALNIIANLSNSTLNPGQCGDYTATYFPTTLAGTNGTASDIVTAQGTAAITNAAVSNNATANCDLCPLGTGGAPNGI